ncbi:DUF2779 domain-containing protein [Kaistella polysaccharea]|uniref:DUF2779 domain-containing protein n=1 Tax=Kaistella polysaccharea TaxID=2878534 RepID=UPI001CF283E2|nr:DUF2779 domain-containing protein [Kaistella polysaccharea]
MKTISKSRFISGVQCSKKIYFDFYRRDLKIPVNDATQSIFNLGHKIGSLAQKAFPNGKDATPENFTDFTQSISNTKQWIQDGEENIYEATFEAENGFVMLDILHRESDELWAIEVKNSTSVKDYHLQDSAFQYWVMTKAGYRPDKFFLMHINNQYIKEGEITHELFHLEDITNTVIKMQSWVTSNLENLLQVINVEVEPVVSVGNHCGNPFSCDYKHHCWKHIPENSVFELTRIGKKSWDLYEKEILSIEDIPTDYPLSFNQRLQYNGLKNNESHYDEDNIRNFLSQWEYPLHFFDFETIMPAIPILDGTRPYQQVPFQYSLHILTGAEEAGAEHKEFLADAQDFTNGGVDPRKKMINQMKLDFRSSGSIVTYNKSFEIRILNELSRDFPEDADYLFSIIDRIVDLLDVFKYRWLYTPAMGSSVSIKSVLPAISPEFTYENLEIQDGGSASGLFLESVLDNDHNTPKLRNNLLSYCERDTYGMVVIYKFLVEKLRASLS